ncbi:MAG: hypothetical protein Q7T51_00815 [Candidatus Moranbacteria bacterium]|nr:hypothetical protein [Candidatus Moranbacteria bacterium]
MEKGTYFVQPGLDNVAGGSDTREDLVKNSAVGDVQYPPDPAAGPSGQSNGLSASDDLRCMDRRDPGSGGFANW